MSGREYDSTYDVPIVLSFLVLNALAFGHEIAGVDQSGINTIGEQLMLVADIFMYAPTLIYGLLHNTSS